MRYGNSRVQKVILANRVLKVQGTKSTSGKGFIKHEGTQGTRHVRHEARGARHHIRHETREA